MSTTSTTLVCPNCRIGTIQEAPCTEGHSKTWGPQCTMCDYSACQDCEQEDLRAAKKDAQFEADYYDQYDVGSEPDDGFPAQ